MATHDASALRDCYDRLLDISREAVADGHHEVAYHALAAALHAAQDGGDRQRLLHVQATAMEYLTALDAASPGHRLSSTGRASRPNGPNLYAMLARQAGGQADLVKMRLARPAPGHLN
jgi:hypothetical protein